MNRDKGFSKLLNLLDVTQIYLYFVDHLVFLIVEKVHLLRNKASVKHACVQKIKIRGQAKARIDSKLFELTSQTIWKFWRN